MKKNAVWISFILLLVLAAAFEQPLLQAYDRAVILFFEGVRTEFLTVLFYMFTEIGSFKVLFPAAIILSIGLIVKKHYLEAFFLMLAFWGGRALNHILKTAFERERPSFHSVIEAGGYSFPSGHAMNSTVFFGFLFYLFTYLYEAGKKQRRIGLAATVGTVALIAVSRVYLGVHYLSDIIAGVCGGFLYVAAVIYLHQLIISRQEPPRPH